MITGADTYGVYHNWCVPKWTNNRILQIQFKVLRNISYLRYPGNLLVCGMYHFFATIFTLAPTYIYFLPSLGSGHLKFHQKSSKPQFLPLRLPKSAVTPCISQSLKQKCIVSICSLAKNCLSPIPLGLSAQKSGGVCGVNIYFHEKRGVGVGCLKTIDGWWLIWWEIAESCRKNGGVYNLAVIVSKGYIL